MADNEQAEGADGAEAASAKRGRLKLVIALAAYAPGRDGSS
jgi:flagellar FliL protein